MSPEQFYIDYLTDELTPPPVNGVAQPGVPVSGSVPHPMPAEFVTVELTGSRRTDLIDTVQLVVLCWSSSRAAACALYEQVNAAMLASISSPEISRCAVETGYNDTDTQTNRPRYHARYEVVYLGG